MSFFDDIERKIPGFNSLKLREIVSFKFSSEGNELNLTAVFNYEDQFLVKLVFCDVTRVLFEVNSFPMELAEILISECDGGYIVYDDLMAIRWKSKEIMIVKVMPFV